MEHMKASPTDCHSPFSFSNLFNLEPLISFKIPNPDEECDHYESSSQDGSRDSQVGGGMKTRGNGSISGKGLTLGKRKRNSNYSEEDEDEERSYQEARVTEEKYRSMLGDHIKMYKRRPKESLITPTSAAASAMGVSALKSVSGGSKFQNLRTDVEKFPEWPNGNAPKRSDYRDPDLAYKVSYEPAYWDIGEGVAFRIPQSYDKLAVSLCLPSFQDIHVNDAYLKGTLDLGSLAGMIANEKRFGTKFFGGIGELPTQYESLHAKLKALASSHSSQKFDLTISEDALRSSIPEGAAGNIQRSILSEGGVLQVFYVKVLEKGDTYEIIERSLPKKPKLKKDQSVIDREEMERLGKLWTNIVKKDIPKHHRIFATFHRKQLLDAKRFSESCQREVKIKISRSIRSFRGAAVRTRKLARDMVMYWKRVDKEMAEVRKREEREAAEALKREQELREAKRQQQRLNFLIQQTELYSHFMQNKQNSEPSVIEGEKHDDAKEPFVSLAEGEIGEEEDPEDAEMREEALRAAQDAVTKQKMLTSTFDSECSMLRHVASAEEAALDASMAASNDIDLHNPSTMPVTSTVQSPNLFKGSLKEYQLKGLQWLVNCYEQGLNGILADEMGLGKTIQAMAFLAHLAEEKNIWGPFLVVAPASVLNNWVDEISRFCPDLKTIPYWGGLQERMVLRKNINPKRLYRRDAGFHILITSYQLLVSDEKYFRRVKWQYMVLDEAQAIKSSSSIRWKTLLSFNCRNRLLLTGTPIQNNMAELWALLHFIMPTLFDSHEQFNEWFSKGIENHAEHGGTLNEHQLNRLHAILKPFMLRRVKKDVITELTRKTEITVHCKLSSRQQAFYQAIKNKISLTELFDGNRGHLNEKKIMNLMNIVIQLRKVCNHPELFERNEGSSYLHFGEVVNFLLPPPFGELEDVHFSGKHNPIIYKVPKLVQNEILHSSELFCTSVGHGVYKEMFEKFFNVFSPDHVYHSMFGRVNDINMSQQTSGTFGFTHLMNLSTSEVSFLATSSFAEKLLFSMYQWDHQILDGITDFIMEDTDSNPNLCLDRDRVRIVTKMLLIPSRSSSNVLRRESQTGPKNAPFESLVMSSQDRLLSNIKILHATNVYIPRARAPPICAECSDRNFAYKSIEEFHEPWVKRLLVGFARTSNFNGPRKPERVHPLIQEIDCELPVSQPAFQLTYKIFGSCPPMQSFDPSKLLTDSGKLQTLDILLKRLRAENHRVLLFAQMTKMLNILEDYMNYRKYRYLRLDGSSTIMDRRDMVRDFQLRNDIFVFLLSTRAGGLGINLTAADTVIFYESDWNPTLDLQAMDRAHRLGQTRDVTVYRLICKETVEEKILLRASQKNTVQQLVMTGGHVQGDLLAPEDVVSLLLDDAQLEQKLREVPQARDRPKKKTTKAIRLDAEGDATLEDLTETVPQNNTSDPPQDPEKGKSNAKKRTRNPQKGQEEDEMEDQPSNIPPIVERPKRSKRPKKSVNDNLEPVFIVSTATEVAQT